MDAPRVESTTLGRKTSYTFEQPLTRTDWTRMDALLIDATINGFTAMRFIADDATKVIITHTE